jgi:hypothetical protein
MAGSPKAQDVRKNGNKEYLTQVSVSGYKSVAERQLIEVRPLTILAGANSSGKSSLVQPLLLLKQTLEASYDPGPLLLDGPNIKYTSVDQILSRCSIPGAEDCFTVSLQLGTGVEVTLVFQGEAGKGLRIREMSFVGQFGKGTFRESMTKEELAAALPEEYRELKFPDETGKSATVQWTVARGRCFLAATMMLGGKRVRTPFPFSISPAATVEPHIRRLIHLPGLRGNPRRFYPKTAVGSNFPGIFPDYTASVIAKWQEDDKAKLDSLSRDLKRLGLTWKVAARSIDDTQVELQVGRLPQAVAGGGWDLVNIADVGFGLSQTLPVLVALHAAEPGQIVYIEQPEIHLHPKAQHAMAEVLANAASRGVRVIAETHSILLLMGIQTLVAQGNLSPDLVKLHWFSRSKQDGRTGIVSADLDENGAYGADWPEDFAETELKAQDAYLNASERHQDNDSHEG